MLKTLGRIGSVAAAGALSAALLAGVATAAYAETPSGTPAGGASTGGAPVAPTSPASPASPTSPTASPAGTPAPSASPSGVGQPRDALEDWFAFKNNTPYTWYRDDANTNVQWWDGFGWENSDWRSPGAPPKTIAPGQTAVFEAGTSTSMNVMYDFTDAAGHRLAFQGNNDRFDHAQTWTKINTAAAGQAPVWQESTQYEAASQVPDTDQTFQATMVNTVYIDAAKDPTAAIAALAKSDGDANEEAFAVQKDASGAPEVTQAMGEHERTSAILVNRSSEPATIQGDDTTVHLETSTLSESISYDNSIDIMGVVNVDAKATFNSSQNWSTSQSIDNSLTVPVPSNDVGWKTQAQSVTRATGTFSFHGTDGVNYVLTNEVVDEPGLAYLDPTSHESRPGTDNSAFVGPCSSNSQFCPAIPTNR